MWIWLVVAGLAAIGELLSYDLFLAPVAVAAGLTALIAPIAPVTLQVGVFGGLSLLGIMVLRPVLKRALGLESLSHSAGGLTQSRIVGRRGIVTQMVDASGGQIRIGEGEFWTARAFDPAHTLAPGDAAEVVLVDGIAALVEPIAETAPARVGSQSAIKKGIES